MRQQDDPAIRQRFEQGHHPRTAPPQPLRVWLRVHEGGTQFYRASDQLIYRIDVIDGFYRVHKADTRDGRESVGNFGPPLETEYGARCLVEADAAVEVPIKVRRR